MKTIFLIILSVFTLNSNARAQSPEPTTQEITFIDSRLFDGLLAQELEKGNDVIEVKITGRMSTNNLPARIDKWITAVGENGQVTLKASEPAPQAKFFLTLLPIIFSSLKQYSDERIFEAAKKYNATILYRLDATGDSSIHQIVFSRKK